MSLGTAGDVHPFVGLGIALRDRGHQVTLMVNEHFRSLATENAFQFAPIGTADEYNAALQDPDIWKSVAGPRVLGRAICQAMPRQYEAICDHFQPGNTVVVASLGGVGARLAHEKLGVPLVSVVLQPATLLSIHRMPVLAGVPRMPDWTPLAARRIFLRCAEPVIDRIFGIATINDFRHQLDLPVVKSIVNDWWLSPQRIIALFPAWFGAPQPDWPAQLRTVGFPLYDGRTRQDSLPERAMAFLNEGDPPIVFTPGSGNVQAHAFFDAAVDACELLGRRGILLTRYPNQLPRRLPGGVEHFDFIPFSQLLSRAAALVHHGGVGTLAQGLAAGIPQLIMPIAYDQPDNADRLKGLGAGDWLKPSRFRGPAVAEKLDRLLRSASVTAACRMCADRMGSRAPLEESCVLIEEMLRTPSSVGERLEKGAHQLCG